MRDNIISALIGLSGACASNPKTEDTDRIVISALAADMRDPDARTADAIVDGIHAERAKVAPGCLKCENPCGSTSDYDMARLYAANEDVRAVKLDIINEIERAAFFAEASGDLADIQAIYKALSYISFDADADAFSDVLDEVRELAKIMERTEK